MELLSKISIKGIGAQPKASEVPEGSQPIRLAVLYGRTNGYTVGQSSFGEFTKFRGSFEAVNARTGEEFKSGAILLPRVVEDLLREALDSREDDNAALDFALEIGVKNSSAPIGYEYTVKPLTELKVSDELLSLRQIATKALPAPTNSEPDAKAAKGKK